MPITQNLWDAHILPYKKNVKQWKITIDSKYYREKPRIFYIFDDIEIYFIICIKTGQGCHQGSLNIYDGTFRRNSWQR